MEATLSRLHIIDKTTLSFQMADEWIRTFWYIYTMEYYSAIAMAVSIVSPSVCLEVMGPDAMIFVF